MFLKITKIPSNHAQNMRKLQEIITFYVIFAILFSITEYFV